NFVLTWLVAGTVQVSSGVIQYGIYKQAKRSYNKATARRLQEGDKNSPLLGFGDDSGTDDEQSGALSRSATPPSSEGSEDCIAAVGGGELCVSGEAPF